MALYDEERDYYLAQLAAGAISADTPLHDLRKIFYASRLTENVIPVLPGDDLQAAVDAAAAAYDSSGIQQVVQVAPGVPLTYVEADGVSVLPMAMPQPQPLPGRGYGMPIEPVAVPYDVPMVAIRVDDGGASWLQVPTGGYAATFAIPTETGNVNCCALDYCHFKGIPVTLCLVSDWLASPYFTKQQIGLAYYAGAAIASHSKTHATEDIAASALKLQQEVVDSKTALESLTHAAQSGTMDGTTDNDITTTAAHGLTDGTQIRFSALPDGSSLSTTTTYWVRDAASTTFKITTSFAQAATDFTGDGACTFCQWPAHLGIRVRGFIQPGTWTGESIIGTAARVNGPVGRLITQNYEWSMAYYGSASNRRQRHFGPSFSVPWYMPLNFPDIYGPSSDLIILAHGIADASTWGAGGTTASWAEIKAMVDKIASWRDAGGCQPVTLDTFFAAVRGELGSHVPHGTFSHCKVLTGLGSTPIGVSTSTGTSTLNATDDRIDRTGTSLLAVNDIIQFATLPTAAGTCDNANDRINTASAHGLIANDPVSFTSLPAGSGLEVGVLYYVESVLDTNPYWFKVARAAGGSALTLTADGTCAYSKTGLAIHTPYYIESLLDTNPYWIKVKATVGGAAIDIKANGTCTYNGGGINATGGYPEEIKVFSGAGDGAADVITTDDIHGLVDTTPVQFIVVPAGSGLSVGTTYYVLNATSYTLQVETVLGSATPVTLLVDGELRFTRCSGGKCLQMASKSQVALVLSQLQMMPGRTYVFEFDAKATTANQTRLHVMFNFLQDANAWTWHVTKNAVGTSMYPLLTDTGWNTYRYVVTVPTWAAPSNIWIVAQDNRGWMIDNIKLTQV